MRGEVGRCESKKSKTKTPEAKQQYTGRSSLGDLSVAVQKERRKIKTRTPW